MRSHASFADWELNLLGIRSYHSEKGGQDEIPRVRRGRARGIFWWHLLKGGADVTFLVRPKRAAQLQRDGLVVKAQDGEIRTPAKAIQQDQLQGPMMSFCSAARYTISMVQWPPLRRQ